jgi:hypothetical protein
MCDQPRETPAVLLIDPVALQPGDTDNDRLIILVA